MHAVLSGERACSHTTFGYLRRKKSVRPMSRGALYLRPSTLKTYKELDPKFAGTSLLKSRSANPGFQQASLADDAPRETSDPGEGDRTVSIICNSLTSDAMGEERASTVDCSSAAC